MRIAALLTGVIAAVLMSSAWALPAHSANLAGDAATAEAQQAAAPQPAAQQQEIDENDDTRVEVQVVVLAIVIGTVFAFGTAAYLVRKRLGLVPPPPEQGSDGHH
jgi:hypothetical protein